MYLTSKEIFKAKIAAKKICRLSESSLNDKYKKIRAEIKHKDTTKKRKEWLGVMVDIIEEHLDKCAENFSNQTIPDLDY